MAVIPTLTDGVVRLRPPSDDDIEGSFEQCQDPLSQRWTTAPVPYTRDDARTYLRHIIPGGWETDREWGFVVEADDDSGVARFAGTISLRNKGERRAEIAYGSHPWARGRGAMERALRLLLDWGFAERELETVIWVSERGNWASRRLAWKLGFTLDGSVRGWLHHRGALRDAWTGTLLRGEDMTPRNPWFDSATIVDEAVVLRETTETDLPRLVDGGNDLMVQRYSQRLRELAPHSERSMRSRELGLREERARGVAVSWTVADPQTDELLGWIALFDIHLGDHAEIGYWAHPDARGRGAISRACRLVVRHAFIDAEDGGLGLRRLTAVVAEENQPSNKIMEHAGFVRAGVDRKSVLLPDGSWADALRYDQLREDFT